MLAHDTTDEHHHDEEPTRQRLSLDAAASNILEECRMVLPGIQALFGFQLIAVFNQGFSERLTVQEQHLHLVSILLVVASIALVMAPAALHRQAEPHSVSDRFLHVSSRLLLWGMLPLAVGISLEVYLIGQLILHDETMAVAMAIGVFVLFALLWLILPLRERYSRGAER
jgi:hypothetical protein